MQSFLDDLSLEIKNLGENNIEYEKDNLLCLIKSFRKIDQKNYNKDWASIKAQNFLPY